MVGRKKTLNSLFYCPNCDEIGRIDQIFLLLAEYQGKEEEDFHPTGRLASPMNQFRKAR